MGDSYNAPVAQSDALPHLTAFITGYGRWLAVVLGLLLVLSFWGVTTVNALPTPNFCFAVGDDGDRLHTMSFDGTNQTEAPNASGVPDIEAIAFNPRTQVLYAADADTLGTLNYDFSDPVNGGVFTPIGAFGTARGALGTEAITDVDSLTFDPFNGTLYGVERRLGTLQDLLIVIDTTTGRVVPDAFGVGVDYLVIDDNDPGTEWDTDIDDIAINPIDNTMYAIANAGGTGDHLVAIDRVTGALSSFGVLINAATGGNAEDMEGLAFFNDGTLYGTTGNNSSTNDQDSLWRLNIGFNPDATVIAQFDTDGDYESVDCLIGDPNNKSGFVFGDENDNGLFDPGEPPLQGVTVEIYRDTGIVSGVIDTDDVFLADTITDVNGRYDFFLGGIGTFILQVDITSLPPGITVTDNIEFAIFTDCNSLPFDDFGCEEPNNNFPTAEEASLLIEKTDNLDPATVGDTVTYTITVTNDGFVTLTDVTVTDTFSGAAFNVASVNSSQGSCTAFPCNLGTLASSDDATITVSGTAAAAGTITNSASVTGNDGGGNPVADTTDEDTTVNDAIVNPPPPPVDPPPPPTDPSQPPADPPQPPTDPSQPPADPVAPTNLTFASNPITSGAVTAASGVTLTKAADANILRVGERITFTITVSNPTAAPVSGVTIVDDVPANYEILSVNSTRGTVSTVGNRVQVSIGTLAPRETVTATIQAQSIAAVLSVQGCNSASLDADTIATVCPQVFPQALPALGESPWTPFRNGLALLLTGIGLAGVLWQVRRRATQSKV